MASKAKQRQAGTEGIVERLCSITSTGVVVMTTQALEISSEVSITVQTNLSGENREWQILGWVVECQNVHHEPLEQYQVTLLFSSLPQGFKELLAGQEVDPSVRLYPAQQGAEIFGMN